MRPKRKLGNLFSLTVATLTLIAVAVNGNTAEPTAHPAVPVASLTALDARRLAMLRALDSQIPVATEEPALAGPNLMLAGEDDPSRYQQKVLAILGLVDAGATPSIRVSEANRLLRYSMHKWPVTEPGQLRGQYAKVWNHHSRTLALRIYCLYASRLEEDILAEYRQRLKWLVAPALRRSSENIRFTNNSAYFLAHEAMYATDRESYADVKGWLIENMQAIGVTGAHEWGRNYLSWTIGAILNLAEFAEDEEIRRLATMAVDYYLAQVSGFVVNGNYGSSAVRMWKWTFSPVLPQTAMVRTLFPKTLPMLEDGLRVEWIVSNYRPPKIVAELVANEHPSEARITTGQEKWRHHVWRGDRVLIATHQAIRKGRFDLHTGGTHGVLGVYIQSAKSPRNCVFPFGCSPMTPPKKQRNLTERYFGYHNIGFAQHGGVVRAVWAGGGRFPDIPIRLFYSFGFKRRLEDGWAFLTDGEAYVAWRPTLGKPVDDPDANSRTESPKWGGRWLKSTHVPGPEGETSIVEVGDAMSFGSFEAFCRDILTRNPSPTWLDDKVVYQCRNGAIIEFGSEAVKINGAVVTVKDYPRAEMPGVRDYTIFSGGTRVTFDFRAVEMDGLLPRSETSLVFGKGRVAAHH